MNTCASYKEYNIVPDSVVNPPTALRFINTLVDRIINCDVKKNKGAEEQMQHTTGQSTEQPMLQPTDQSTSTMHNYSLRLIVLGGRSHVLTGKDLRMIPSKGDECSLGGTRVPWSEHTPWLEREMSNYTIAAQPGQTASPPTEGVQLFRKAQPSEAGDLWAPKGANCTSWTTTTKVTSNNESRAQLNNDHTIQQALHGHKQPKIHYQEAPHQRRHL